jgi:NADPH-dependent 2,4-dienoyl-CoA reductase/sulfur reductase-like enzyme
VHNNNEKIYLCIKPSHDIIILTAPPSPPQPLMSRVLESDANYSTVEVTWEPPGNDSRVHFYHVAVVVDLAGANSTWYTVETANTTVTVVLSIFPYNVNITIFLSAMDSCGGESILAVLFLSSGELYYD